MLGVDPSAAKGPGKGQGAGDKAGEDYVETEVTMDELEDLLFEELELPQLGGEDGSQLRRPTCVFQDIRKKGIMSNIDKKRTLLENLQPQRERAAVPAFAASRRRICATKHGRR